MTHINIPYKPRPLQKELHQAISEHRWSVVVCHRRFGKTVAAINHLLRDAILTSKSNPRFAYIAPTYRQAKNVAWDYLKQFASAIPLARFHETELRCDLPNGARIQLLGAENVHAIRGIYLDGVCRLSNLISLASRLSEGYYWVVFLLWIFLAQIRLIKLLH